MFSLSFKTSVVIYLNYLILLFAFNELIVIIGNGFEDSMEEGFGGIWKVDGYGYTCVEVSV